MNAASSTLRTLACFVPASRSELFRFLADIENLPGWAASYCSALELSRGRWLAFTIDLRWGDEREGVRLLPLRVVTIPGGRSLISAVCYQGARQDDCAFEREVAALSFALENLGACLGRAAGSSETGCRMA